MNKFVFTLVLSLALTAALQIRLSHDNRKGYAYQITGPEIEEIIEADKKIRVYLRSQTPKKTTGPAPSSPAARPAPLKK